MGMSRRAMLAAAAPLRRHTLSAVHFVATPDRTIIFASQPVDAFALDLRCTRSSARTGAHGGMTGRVGCWLQTPQDQLSRTSGPRVNRFQ